MEAFVKIHSIHSSAGLLQVQYSLKQKLLKVLCTPNLDDFYQNQIPIIYSKQYDYEVLVVLGKTERSNRRNYVIQ